MPNIPHPLVPIFMLLAFWNRIIYVFKRICFCPSINPYDFPMVRKQNESKDCPLQ